MHVPEAVKPFLIPILSSAIIAGLFLTQQAFAAPTQTPPNGNTATPINGTSTAQTIAGPLTVTNTVTANSVNISGTTTASNVCLPGGCLNYWPSASYSTPSLSSVLDAGNSAGGAVTFNSGSGWTLNNVSKSSMPAPYGYFNNTYTMSVGFGGMHYCPGNDFICAIGDIGGPYHPPSYVYCCNVVINNN